MYLPATYTAQLAFMLLSMGLWGSWANTVKATPGWSFQSFYWDYVVGVVLGSLLWGLGLGGGAAFLSGLGAAALTPVLLAVLSGMIFNAANQLLIASIDLAGLAVAFPIGIGLALIEGVVLNYVLAPAANPLLLFGGVFLVAVAIVVDAIAYRQREPGRPTLLRLGITLSLVSGILMGAFYPFLTRAMSGARALGPYTVVPFFALGVALCALPVNIFLSRRPFVGEPVAWSRYTGARPGWHLWGILGGLLWDAGLQSNLLASRAQMVGPAVSYAIGQGATMVSAAWGVFVWKEFRNSSRRTHGLLASMFVFFLLGLLLIALAPTWNPTWNPRWHAGGRN